MSLSDNELIDLSTPGDVEDTAVEDTAVEDTAVEDTGVDNLTELETKNNVKSETYTVKINGKEESVTKEDLIKGYSTNKAAQEKFREADVKFKQAETLITMLQDDPTHVLQELGIDVRALATDYLSEMIKWESLSPEQRELIETKRKLGKIEKERESEYKTNLDQQTNIAREEYVGRINTALQTLDIPNNEYTVKRMAMYMKEALNSKDTKIQQLSDTAIAELVEEDYSRELKGLSLSKLEALMGKEIADKVRSEKNKKNESIRSKKPVKQVNGQKEKKYMTQSEFNDYLDKLD